MATDLEIATGDYQRSRLSRNQIRLFALKSGADDDMIRFALTKHPFDDLPPYEALSYAWGDSKRDKTCFCQDEISSGDFKVTDSLFQALKQLRHVDDDRSLWVDQICIDQTNSEEKSQQIRLMSSIYRQAKQVVIWLGPADPETSLAFSLIENIAVQCIKYYLRVPEVITMSHLGTDPLLELTSADAPEWVAYRRLFKRSWFARLWVFQEIALSKSATIICGNYSVSWSAFVLVLNSVMLAETAAVDGKYLPTGEPIGLAFQRLRIRDYMPDEIYSEFRRKRLGTLTVKSESEPSSVVAQGPDTNILSVQRGNVANQSLAATTDQHLVVTDSGYIGLVHHSCMVGDSIFILMGGDMPCVLRKLETGTYAFQGEAYVHGIMDGEYLLRRFSSHQSSSPLNSDAEEWLDSLSVDPLPFDTETVVLS